MAQTIPVKVAEPVVAPRTKKRKKTRRKPSGIPRYHVLLWNDDDHTYEYVIVMLKELFGHPVEVGFQLAEQVHTQGKAVVCTTTKERAEFKRDQIHAYGKDFSSSDCAGSMFASIEAAR